MLPALLLILQTSAAQAAPPARISSGVMAGLLVHRVTPQFPEEARRAHVNGAVVLHVIIGEDGTVRDVTPISGPEILRQPYMPHVDRAGRISRTINSQ